MRSTLQLCLMTSVLALGTGLGGNAATARAQGQRGPSTSHIRRPDHRGDFRIQPYPYYPGWGYGYGPGYWGGWGYSVKSPWWGYGYDNRRYFGGGKFGNRSGQGRRY